MLDRGLHRTYGRAATAEAEAAADEPVRGRRARGPHRPAHLHDRSRRRQDFDDAISARREDGRVRVWVHIADVTAYVRPGGALEREALRRATSVYVPGAVEPMLPEALSTRACSLRPGEDKLAVTVEMEMDGTEVRKVVLPPLAGAQRPAAHLRRGGRDLRRARPRRGALGRARSRPRARSPARSPRGATRVEIGNPEPTFEFDSDGHVTGVRYEQQTESHRLIEQLMVLANEQVAGYLADHRLPTLYRVHERPEPRAVAFLGEQLASLDIPTPPLPEHMTPQQAADAGRRDVAHRGARGARPHAPSAGWCCARSSRPTTRRRTSATPGSAARATATSPRRSAATRTWWRTARCCRGSASTTPPRPPHELPELGRAHARRTEREAMKIERGADDVCLAFLLERRLAERRGRHVRGRGRRPDREGRLRPLRRGGLRGAAAEPPAARLVDAQRAGHGARARGLGPAPAPRRPGRGDRRSRRDGARAGRPVARRCILVGAHGQEAQAQSRRRRRRHQPPGGVSVQPARAARGRHRAPGLGGEVAAQRLGPAQGRLRRGAGRRGLAAQHAHRALRARARGPRPRATAQAAAAQARDRAADRQDGREGADDRADADLLLGPRAKVELAVATGKQQHDKRRAIKERDVRREIDRALSER